jgi:hypothetical protein
VSKWVEYSLLVRRSTHRVGARITANKRCGVFNRDCKTGIAKAPVFPDPVSASPITSWPPSAAGIACFWISVGAVQPMDEQASHKDFTTPWRQQEHGTREEFHPIVYVVTSMIDITYQILESLQL